MLFIQQVSLLCILTDRQAGPQQNSKEQIDMHINTKTQLIVVCKEKLFPQWNLDCYGRRKITSNVPLFILIIFFQYTVIMWTSVLLLCWLLASILPCFTTSQPLCKSCFMNCRLGHCESHVYLCTKL